MSDNKPTIGVGKYHPNSANYWLDKMDAASERAGVDVLTPATETVDIDALDLMAEIEERGDAPTELYEVAETVGYPVFVRSDLASAKRRGIDSFRACTPDGLPGVVMETLEANAYENKRPASLLFREFLDLDAAFTAFGGTPIAPEYRLVADADTVYCCHWYWPKESIVNPSDEQWEDELAAMQDRLTTADEATLSTFAQAVVDECGGGVWTVDVARDTTGDWWGIDMALAADSWHPDDCAALDGVNLEYELVRR